VRPLLRGERRLELALPPAKAERRRASASSSRSQAGDGWGDADPELVTRLKAWRTEQARSQGVPSYVVFHDRTLLELASRRPGSLAELAEVSGIGAAKLERYGEALVELLACAAQRLTAAADP